MGQPSNVTPFKKPEAAAGSGAAAAPAKRPRKFLRQNELVDLVLARVKAFKTSREKNG